MEKDILVVAHGDLDGIISTVCLMKEFVLSIEHTEIIFTQPFLVDKLEIPEAVKENNVFVVDIAVNNRDPEMTKEFIKKIGNRLAVWYDHHKGWSQILGWESTGGDTYGFVVDSTAQSCAELVRKNDELVADATAADTRQGKLSPRAQLIEQATKANMADDTIRLLAVKWLLGDASAREGLEAAAKKYVAIQTETERLAATYLVGIAALVDARQSNHQYDLTQLLLEGQKMSPFAVVLTSHPQQGEGLTIATSRKDVNLVELFGLGSGAPFRVSLPIKRLEEAMAKLRQFSS